MGDHVDELNNVMPAPGNGRPKRARIDKEGNFVAGKEVYGYNTSVRPAVRYNISTNSSAANSVKAYGAVGDGVTDDTLAVQTAFQAVQNGLIKKLCFPAGTYLVNAGRIITGASNFAICGEGKDVSIIKLQTGGNSITLDTCSNFCVKDLQIDCNYRTLGSGGQGFVLLDCTFGMLHNVKIIDWLNSCILAYARNSATLRPRDIIFNNLEGVGYAQSIQGFVMVDHFYSHYYDCIMRDLTQPAGTTGPAFQFKNDSRYCTMDGLYSFNCRAGLAMGGDSLPHPIYCSAYNMFFNGGGIELGTCSNCHVKNAFIDLKSDANADALRFGAATNCSATNITAVNLGTSRSFYNNTSAGSNINIQFDSVTIPTTGFGVAVFAAGSTNQTVIISEWNGTNSQWIKASNTINNYIQANSADATCGVKFLNRVISVVPIVSGNVVVPTSKSEFVLRLVPETGTTDTLNTITGAGPFQKVSLVTNQLSSDTITLAYGTGADQFLLPSNLDRTLDNRRDMQTYYYRTDYTTPVWTPSEIS